MFITIVIILTTPFRIYERLRFWRKVRDIEIDKPPIFIVGHWRSGTTYLHKLLTRNDEFRYLDFADLAFPNMMLGRFNNWLTHTMLKPFVPEKRVTDDVKMSTKMPHEHEHGLMQINIKSPYIATVFPTNRDYYMRYLTLNELDVEEKTKWKGEFKFLIKKAAYKYNQQQLVLKSPSDTARIGILLEMFPDAKFIHIRRNPYDVIPSTLKLYKRNKDIARLQSTEIDYIGLALSTYREVYDTFFRDVHLIHEDNYIEVTYKDMVNQPIENLEKIYQTFSLPNVNYGKEKAEAYLNSLGEYTPSTYELTEDTKNYIQNYLNTYIDRWDYTLPESTKIVKQNKQI